MLYSATLEDDDFVAEVQATLVEDTAPVEESVQPAPVEQRPAVVAQGAGFTMTSSEVLSMDMTSLSTPTKPSGPASEILVRQRKPKKVKEGKPGKSSKSKRDKTADTPAKASAKPPKLPKPPKKKKGTSPTLLLALIVAALWFNQEAILGWFNKQGEASTAPAKKVTGAGAAVEKLGHVKVFIAIISSAEATSAERRAAQRETWLPSATSANGVAFKFFVGTPEDPQAESRLLKEAAEFGDMVMLPVGDQYKELPNKVLESVRWAYKSSGYTFDFLGKFEDDSYSWLPTLVARLKAHEDKNPSDYPPAEDGEGKGGAKKRKGGMLFAGVMRDQVPPSRNPQSKLYMPNSEFPDDVYPPFCMGPAYILSKAGTVQQYSTHR
jgi:hypothetical protein